MSTSEKVLSTNDLLRLRVLYNEYIERERIAKIERDRIVKLIKNELSVLHKMIKNDTSFQMHTNACKFKISALTKVLKQI